MLLNEWVSEWAKKWSKWVSKCINKKWANKLADWLASSLNNWLTVEWLTNWFTDWLTGWPTSWWLIFKCRFLYSIAKEVFLGTWDKWHKRGSCVWEPLLSVYYELENHFLVFFLFLRSSLWFSFPVNWGQWMWLQGNASQRQSWSDSDCLPVRRYLGPEDICSLGSLIVPWVLGSGGGVLGLSSSLRSGKGLCDGGQDREPNQTDKLVDSTSWASFPSLYLALWPQRPSLGKWCTGSKQGLPDSASDSAWWWLKPPGWTRAHSAMWWPTLHLLSWLTGKFIPCHSHDSWPGWERRGRTITWIQVACIHSTQATP